ncbi:MAG TPA: chitinase [Betaproteobacteria bacterium]|nr:chitinase [Betaproteobacteria bacterium]
MVTKEQLLAIMPLAGSRAEAFLAPLNDAMREYAIDTGLREAAFLAQIAHESGQLRFTRELWGPTAAQSRYEGRADLGNTESGDGKRFLGRGLIQLTGRANYRACGEALGLDLIDDPRLLEQPPAACRSAGWFWQRHGLNTLADQEQFRTITRRINGGLNGIQEREAYYARALKALGEEYV